MPGARSDELHSTRRLQQIDDLQGFGRLTLLPPRTPSITEAICLGYIDLRDKEEGLLDTLYRRLVRFHSVRFRTFSLTLSSFSAVLLGLPRQIKDEDVHCELPVDADDEYVTERGFQPLLPGESTRLSSALALFRASRILAKVLEEVYPAQTSYELSLQKLSALAEELDQWQASLAPHLKLPFAHDKPTIGTVSSRSPLLVRISIWFTSDVCTF